MNPDGVNELNDLYCRNYHPREVICGTNSTTGFCSEDKIGCKADNYTQRVEDERYRFDNYQVNEYDMQLQSGVIEVLKNLIDVDLFYYHPKNTPNTLEVKEDYNM